MSPIDSETVEANRLQKLIEKLTAVRCHCRVTHNIQPYNHTTIQPYESQSVTHHHTSHRDEQTDRRAVTFAYFGCVCVCVSLPARSVSSERESAVNFGEHTRSSFPLFFLTHPI